jgi:MarR family transcriptional regulator, transcriptional regulator for hemolysin
MCFIMKIDIDKNLGIAIHDVARLLRLSFDRQSQGIGLTRAQWSVLVHLLRNDGVQQKTLAQLMEITPITLARHLDRLEVEAWIERRDDPDDRRAKRVFLNPKGKAVMASLGQLGQKIRRHAMEGVSPEQEELFMDVLLRIRTNLCDTDRQCETLATHQLLDN